MVLLFLSQHFLLKKVQTLQSGFQGSHLIPPYLCSLILLLFLFFTPVRLTHEALMWLLPVYWRGIPSPTHFGTKAAISPELIQT